MEASLNIDTSCLHSYILNSGVKKRYSFLAVISQFHRCTLCRIHMRSCKRHRLVLMVPGRLVRENGSRFKFLREFFVGCYPYYFVGCYSSPLDEDWHYCSRNVAINIKSDSIVRQTNKVHLLSYTTMNNQHIFYYKNQLCCVLQSYCLLYYAQIFIIFLRCRH